MVEDTCQYALDNVELDETPAEGAELLVVHRRGLAFCQVLARRNRSQAVAHRLGISKTPGTATEAADFTALPLAPRQWLLTAPYGRDGAFTCSVRERIYGDGYASEQSHGRSLIRLRGKAAPDLLAKECRLDLHPDSAPRGFVGQTNMVGIGVLVHCVDDQPTFDLVLYPGYAESFLVWIRSASIGLSVSFSEESVGGSG